MPTPNWQAARDGLPGDANATNKSALINQFLGTHANTTIYQGNSVVTAVPGGGDLWPFHLDAFDYDQPFTMSGTKIGRIAIPLLPVGNGADLTVSLCADASGVPGTVLNTVRIPAKWITSLAAVAGIGPSTQIQVNATPGPLATMMFNTWDYSARTLVAQEFPAAGAGGPASNPSYIYTDTALITAGGDNAGASIPAVASAPWLGNSLGTFVPQPSLPVGTSHPGLVVTGDTIVAAGGLAGGTGTTNVFTASWDAANNVIGSWSTQTALPQALTFHGTCNAGETVYMISGLATSGNNVPNVYYATVQNGQITGWNSAQDLPVAVQDPLVGVVQGFLIVAGGQLQGGTTDSTGVYYMPLNADGTPNGPWLQGPSLPTGIIRFAGNQGTVTNSAIMQFYPGGSGSQAWGLYILPFDKNGPGVWAHLGSSNETNSYPSAIFPGDNEGYTMLSGIYVGGFFITPMYPVPYISVPLPTSGLTNGGAYHILMQQQGGDLSNYLRSSVAPPDTLPGGPTALYRTKGTTPWTAYTSGWSIPLYVYDQTIGGQPWHQWEDSGARIATLVYATTGDARLLGGLEATQFADGTVLPSVWQIDYPSGALWPPIGVTQL